VISFSIPIEVAGVNAVPKDFMNCCDRYRVFAFSESHPLGLGHLRNFLDRIISRCISLKRAGDDRGEIGVRSSVTVSGKLGVAVEDRFSAGDGMKVKFVVALFFVRLQG